MTDRAQSGDIDSEGSAIVVRARLDPHPLAGAPELRIRVETLDDRAIRHFSTTESAIDHLRGLLDAVALPGAADGGR